MYAWGRIALISGIAAAASLAALAESVVTPDTVTFPSADQKTTLTGYVFRPPHRGTERLPAVVMMHGRAGAYSSLADGTYDATTLSKRHKFWGETWPAKAISRSSSTASGRAATRTASRSTATATARLVDERPCARSTPTARSPTCARAPSRPQGDRAARLVERRQRHACGHGGRCAGTSPSERRDGLPRRPRLLSGVRAQGKIRRRLSPMRRCACSSARPTRRCRPSAARISSRKAR